MNRAQDTDNLKYWLALVQTPGIGPRVLQKLQHHFPSPEAILHEKPNMLRALGLKETTISALGDPRWDKVESALHWHQSHSDHHILTLDDPDYPPLLKQISSPPPLLFVHGKVESLPRPQLAIVGSRNPTPGGKQLAHEFAHALSQLGLTITSGLATGIDGAAHEGTLAADGITIGVAATGPDRIYPARHKKIAEKIVTQGAIVSEFPPGTPVKAQNFPRRNRIISGLSLGTLVVEAAIKSGSLITAKYALEQNRAVLAIPGSIHNPLARGCNGLIREGAILVETVEDVLQELNLISPTASDKYLLETTQTAIELTEDYRDLLNKIDYAPTSVDRLVEITGMRAENVASMILVLELQGYVAATAGGCYQRIR
ncbi:MAG: DNA processing protein DprA [Methylothermaceae bacteria B42]|nr:MAG: DNA processing protein DprA [Methylothermaceae bacteria B42]